MTAAAQHPGEPGTAIKLETQGLGIILYSPFAAANIKEGEDYLSSRYSDVGGVGPHITNGTIVGFGTGSPGTFILKFLHGYPDSTILDSHEFKLRLGVAVRDQTLCVRDLYDLLDWTRACPREQTLSLDDGFYHVTLCSSLPASGVLGDDQEILVYLNPLASMPTLRFDGVPTLCA